MTRTPDRNRTSRHPQHLGRRGGRRSPLTTEVPTIGRWTIRLCTQHRLSRPEAAKRLHISESNLKRIELNDATPSEETLDRMVTEFNLDPDQERHTRELAEPAVDLTPIAELREQLTTPTHLAQLAQFEQNGVACAYIDPLWQLVAANDTFLRVFPGVDEFDRTMPLWHFQPGAAEPTSKRISVFWEYEAAFLIMTLRAAFGRFRTSPQVAELMRRLQASPVFTRMWIDSLRVAYGRGPDDFVHLRDPATGEPHSWNIQFGEIPDSQQVRLCVGYRQPYAGPPLP
ncbi:helix-turn-helix domain-containing protein [Nocardia wallacei]|uniref:MmyB family transcriptional regulator n=1 Tax=Nocardia wallacei TaxID=480035 RepID=UPI002458DD3A|nr:helix-turn-helix domain-containing protein [Nocardia wallacei]